MADRPSASGPAGSARIQEDRNQRRHGLRASSTSTLIAQLLAVAASCLLMGGIHGVTGQVQSCADRPTDVVFIIDHSDGGVLNAPRVLQFVRNSISLFDTVASASARLVHPHLISANLAGVSIACDCKTNNIVLPPSTRDARSLTSLCFTIIMIPTPLALLILYALIKPHHLQNLHAYTNAV